MIFGFLVLNITQSQFYNVLSCPARWYSCHICYDIWKYRKYGTVSIPSAYDSVYCIIIQLLSRFCIIMRLSDAQNSIIYGKRKGCGWKCEYFYLNIISWVLMRYKKRMPAELYYMRKKACFAIWNGLYGMAEHAFWQYGKACSASQYMHKHNKWIVLEWAIRAFPDKRIRLYWLKVSF